jgi:hypothetical protein
MLSSNICDSDRDGDINVPLIGEVTMSYRELAPRVKGMVII